MKPEISVSAATARRAIQENLGAGPALCRVLCFMVFTLWFTCDAAATHDQRAFGAEFPTFHSNGKIFNDAIAREKRLPPENIRLSGITVPHHLLAIDLIARGFNAASGGTYDRIIVLFPDHFNVVSRPFATVPGKIETVLGPVFTDQSAINALLQATNLFESNERLLQDHGLRALLPFIAQVFEGTPIVPVAASLGAYRADWDRAIEEIRRIVTPNTLIIQSTDFSHYLTSQQAMLRDQETLNALAAGSQDIIARMHQPEHMDAKPAQYIQMALQKEIFGAQPIAISNLNSQIYSGLKVKETTSYIVQVYINGNSRSAASSWPTVYPGQKVFYFAGDTLLGRGLTPLLADEKRASGIKAAMRAITRGHPLIINLEGLILDEVPERLRPTAHAMPKSLAIPFLKDLGVIAVSLANNHTGDLGPVAYKETVAILRHAGIAVMEAGRTIDLGAMRVFAISDIDNTSKPFTNRIDTSALEPLSSSSARPPVFAFVHWGREFSAEPGPREIKLAGAFRRRAVAAVVGSHSHRASARAAAIAGGQMQLVYSLGNFIFDQRSPPVTGALLEVRFFAQGTFFSRLIPIGNVYNSMDAHPPAQMQR